MDFISIHFIENWDALTNSIDKQKRNIMYMTTNKKIVKDVCARIAPLWPLKNYIAVNPYMGFSDHSFQDTAKLMAKRSTVKMTLPLSFYKEQYDKGYIKKEHLDEALVENGQFMDTSEFITDVDRFISEPIPERRLKTLLDLLDGSGELNQIMIDNISSFAAAYFDEFQAIWKGKQNGLLSTWLNEAKIDRTPEIAGIKNFRQLVKLLPKKAHDIFDLITVELQLDQQEAEAYFHALLLKLSGWASYIAGVDWNNKLYTSPTLILEELLCILLIWEYVAYESSKQMDLIEAWKQEKKRFRMNELSEEQSSLEMELIFQDAFDKAHQQELIQKINSNNSTKSKKANAAIQAIFCIDVRSEILRRNIENVNTNIETIGFAGFFGFPIKYQATQLDNASNQCPALIPAGPTVSLKFKHIEEQSKAETRKLDKDQFSRSWKYFKSGAVSAFSYVSPLGVFFLPKLIKDSFALAPQKKEETTTPLLDLSNIPLTNQIEMAANALRLIGIKDRLAELVLIIGHGSSSTNNPHASGLDCGACGGHSGKINALTAAQILNDPDVRVGLNTKGIIVPSNTLFAAGLHDTTTDNIEIFSPATITERQEELINEARRSFSEASIINRTERSMRFDEVGPDRSEELQNRAKDWSQVRPEWGLSGCSSFIVGDREITKNVDLEGRTFLHNYDSSKDEHLSTLETIITAPMVVTSWINLQYYASVTDNKNFGAGNKTLHNVTGGIGVIEGSGGDLKTGLPLQSIHDGEKLQHLPNRLNVFIQAPIDAINTILEKHSNVQDLFDNQWISLFRIDENRKVTQKYFAKRNWEEIDSKNQKVSRKTKVELQKV